MSALHDLFDVAGQSPWLDNLRRNYLGSGALEAFLERGVRGITSNPSIFQKAIADSSDYDAQFADLLGEGASVEDAYWRMVLDDIVGAVDRLRPLYDASGGTDGFVSVEVDPSLARDTAGTIDAARRLHEAVDRTNVFIKIPATAEGVPAIRQMIAEGRSVNVTLIFSLDRYDEVLEAHVAGLEDRLAAGEDISAVRSVGSFFISRVDTEVDRRLDAIGTADATALRGQTAVAQGKLAYQRFRAVVDSPRWQALAAAGASVQRPLWASTSTKDPSYPDTLYVDSLIGPDTVNTLPEATLDAFEDHGTVERTVDRDVDAAEALVARVGEIGVDLDDVSATLEEQGVAAFEKSFVELLTTLKAKAGEPG